jgi:hypothetical protein
MDEQIQLIQSEFNVRIHYRYNPDLFFPEAWKQPSLNMAASEIEVSESVRLVPIIRQFLETHPAPLVRDDLQHIYLLKTLSFRGRLYGSTHQNKSMYIICDGVSNRYDDDFMARRLHSEFSSILMEQHPFPSLRWSRINPAGFRYAGNGFEMVDNASRYDSTERSCSEGFLVNYCRSSLQNDFNIISAWLFTRKDELDTLANQHDRLRQKLTLTEQFYASLSDQYTFD